MHSVGVKGLSVQPSISSRLKHAVAGILTNSTNCKGWGPWGPIPGHKVYLFCFQNSEGSLETMHYSRQMLPKPQQHNGRLSKQ